jgi:2-haloacid dehalogenase
MSVFRPKCVTFDCHGTLIDFQMAEAARDLYGDQLSESTMQKFIKNFTAYRIDEVLGAWKPLPGHGHVRPYTTDATCSLR